VKREYVVPPEATELPVLHDRLCELLTEAHRVEEAAKAVAADYREQRKELRKAIDSVLCDIAQAAYSDVPDYERGVVDRISNRTGEVVSSRALTAEERQAHLALTDPDVPSPQRPAPPEVEAELDKWEAKRGG
jgi:hypothetical protein